MNDLRPRARARSLGFVVVFALSACGAPTGPPAASTVAAVATQVAPSANAAATQASAAAPTAAAAAAQAAPTVAAAGTAAASLAPTVVAVATAAAKPGAAAASDRVWSIGIFQLTSHPALDACRDGITRALADNGFVEGKNVKIDRQNAQGDIPTLTSIAQRFLDAKVDVIVADSTPALLVAAKLTQGKDTPAVVFDCVSDPYQAAPVAKSPTDKPANLTGVQALAPVEDGLKLVKEIVPNAKRVGMVYNPAEPNSELATRMAKQAAPGLGLEIVDATVSRGDEVLTAAQSLAARQVDAFFVSTDSTVVASLESLVKVAQDSGIPLIGNDPDSAKRGAVAAIGLDYVDSGYQAGLMVVKIVRGGAVKDIPIERQMKGYLAVNTAAAAAQKVTLPDALMSRANEKYDRISPRQ